MSTPTPDSGRSRPRRARAHARTRPALDPDWAPQDALTVARECGLAGLGDHHWKIITSCREEVARTGRRPTLHQLATLTGFDAGTLHALFPGDFDTLISRIAGLARRPHAPRDRTGGGSKEN